ncbi:MAG: efflux RND transporter periplasmic adaptor subunit [Planctomycetes bacterium]|nr:efflux RND transporter periplasmic adaptor subunit [Planctomycetota bacterium]
MPAENAASADLNKLRIDRAERREPRAQNRRSPWPWIFLILMIGAGYLGYQYWKNELSVPELATTRVVLVSPNESNALLTASGYVVAQTKVTLGAKSPRRLVERFVNEGDHVTKDQVLARLDHLDVDSRHEQAKASVISATAAQAQSEAAVARSKMAIEKALAETEEIKSKIKEAQARRDGDEREVKRFKEAEKAGAGVRKDRELAETQLQMSTASLETLKQQLKTADLNVQWMRKDAAAAEADVAVKKAQVTEREMDVLVAESAMEDTVIRAPFAGVILLKQSEVGESVSPGVVSGQVTSGSIFQIADFDTLEAEVDVNESNVSKVKNDQPCEIQVDAIPNRAFRGSVRLLMPGGNRQKATVAAKVKFLETDPALRPELGCKVVFLREAAASQAAPKLLAPRSAFRADGGRKYAFSIRDGKLHKRFVDIRDAGGDRVEIAAGLVEGDEIVQDNSEGLADGAPAKLKKN